MNQTATLDEIKWAFKKRALQVHPDKGGSKEAFHLVYEALETLVDPEARRKYDENLQVKRTRSQPQANLGKRKTYRKRDHFATRKEARAHAEKAGMWTNQPREGSKAETKPEAPGAVQSKILVKIHDLLKKLPRDARNDVLTKQFSEKQRLILEQWMVDISQSGREGPLALDTEIPTTCAAHVQTPNPSTFLPPNCTSLALPSISFARKAKPSKRVRNKKDPNRKVRSTSGYLKKDGFDNCTYRAGICFDSFEMLTRKCDMQTALEYLVVLTAAKQKMRDSKATGVHFEERLQGALIASAKEHEKDLADLRLSFLVVQAAGFFIGVALRAPTVRSVEKLGRMRACLESFRQYAKNGGNRCLYWQYSPIHLQNAWQRFQNAVADAWQIADVDSSLILEKIRARHAARNEFRARQLQKWELGHMAMQDKNKIRSKKLQAKDPHVALSAKERRWMALEDRNRHRPKKFRVQLNLRRFSSDSSRHVLALKRLLVRWERLLKREARVMDKERRRVLQQRRKAQIEQKRLEGLNQKRLRNEERRRREALRKRMRCDLTMEEIFADRSVPRSEAKRPDCAAGFIAVEEHFFLGHSYEAQHFGDGN